MGHAVMMQVCCGTELGVKWMGPGVSVGPWPAGRMSGPMGVSFDTVCVQCMLLPGWLALHCNDKGVSKGEHGWDPCQPCEACAADTTAHHHAYGAPGGGRDHHTHSPELACGAEITSTSPLRDEPIQQNQITMIR